MLVKHTTQQAVERAIAETGLTVPHHSTNGTMKHWKIKLWTEDPNGPYRNNRGRVCWHGYRDFLSSLFRSTPTAKILLNGEWYSVDDFEWKYRETFYRPLNEDGTGDPVCQGCDCEQAEMEGEPHGT